MYAGPIAPHGPMGSQAPPIARCALKPNASAAPLRPALPWIGTIVLLCLVSGIGSALHVGQTVMTAIAVPLIAGGLGLSVWVALRGRGPAFFLEVDMAEVRLREAESGQVVASAPRAAVRATPAMHRLDVRNMHFEYPYVALPLPAKPDLSVGVYDARFGWTGGAVDAPAPGYLVSAADWITLTGALGLSAMVAMR